MLTSLVGARRQLHLADGRDAGRSSCRTGCTEKKPANSGMYGFACGPPSDIPKPSISSQTYSMAFCALPGIIARPRVISTSSHDRDDA